MTDPLNAPVRAERLLDRLTDEQRAFAESDAAHLCCVAAAGSGKTTAVAARVVHLVRVRGVDPRQIRVFVFTRAARHEIASRVELVLGPEAARAVDVTTFHGFAARVLLRAEPSLLLATETTSEAYLRSLYDGPTRRRGVPGIETVRHSIVAHEAGAHNGDHDAARAVGIVLGRMAETNAVPMWDLLPRATGILEDDDALDGHLRRHVIVDEAQDVTPREEAVARRVATHVAAVGDPRQAIMGFRGAVGMCGIEAAGAFDHRANGHLYLTRSHRFGPSIAAAANRFRSIWGRPTFGNSAIDDFVLRPDNHDAVVAAHKDAPASLAVLCRTHDECHVAAAQLSNLGLRVHYAGRRDESVEALSDPFADAVALGAAVVSTIHGAKGREFDAVYVPDSDIEPRWDDDAECAYVAATRARKALWLGRVRWAGL